MLHMREGVSPRAGADVVGGRRRGCSWAGAEGRRVLRATLGRRARLTPPAPAAPSRSLATSMKRLFRCWAMTSRRRAWPAGRAVPRGLRFTPSPLPPRRSDALDTLELKRYCCRRMILTHVELIEKLLNYNSACCSVRGVAETVRRPAHTANASAHVLAHSTVSLCSGGQGRRRGDGPVISRARRWRAPHLLCVGTPASRARYVCKSLRMCLRRPCGGPTAASGPPGAESVARGQGKTWKSNSWRNASKSRWSALSTRSRRPIARRDMRR